jgi:hypothetical protein
MLEYCWVLIKQFTTLIVPVLVASVYNQDFVLFYLGEVFQKLKAHKLSPPKNNDQVLFFLHNNLTTT